MQVLRFDMRLRAVQPLFLFLALLFAVSQASYAQQEQLPIEAVTIRKADGVEHVFRSEMAISPQQQATGMMFRTEMAPDAGMLFVFGEVRRASFWMRNTLIPLDIIFVRPNGRIANIVESATPETDAHRRSIGRVAGVLEIAGGRAAELGIKAGDLIIHSAFGGWRR